MAEDSIDRMNRLKKEIRANDFAVRHDYEGKDWNTPIMYISTENDPSVGIFGQPVSPNFRTYDALEKWWKKNKTRLVKKYG